MRGIKKIEKKRKIIDLKLGYMKLILYLYYMGVRDVPPLFNPPLL
jgi:hypothetical protein